MQPQGGAAGHADLPWWSVPPTPQHHYPCRHSQEGDEVDLAFYEQWEPKEPKQLDLDLSSLGGMDTNQLQTALSMAIEAEDYDTAAVVRDVLQQAMAAKAASAEPGAKVLDWRALGLPDWLADRAERLGFRYPTGVWVCMTAAAAAAGAGAAAAAAAAGL
jgi:hypothetical protein